MTPWIVAGVLVLGMGISCLVWWLRQCPRWGPLTFQQEGEPPAGIARWLELVPRALPELRGPVVLAWSDGPISLGGWDGRPSADVVRDEKTGRIDLMRDPGALLHGCWHLDQARRQLAGGEPDQAWVSKWVAEMRSSS